MPTMKLLFPGGLYHATHGLHHVNEGTVEWPPSPLRLVRSLIACGYSTLQWNEIPNEGRELFESLCSVLPEYRIPPAALGHSRHYMPLARIQKERELTTQVIDAFADIGEGELWVRWLVNINRKSDELFSILVANLPYLGRSESWVIGESISDEMPLPLTGSSFPLAELNPPGSQFEQFVLLAPERPDEYATWRATEVNSAASGMNGQKLQRNKIVKAKQIDKFADTYPVDLLDSLQRDTYWWRSKKWSRPPGRRTVVYWRERNVLEVGPSLEPRIRLPSSVDMILLALTTPKGSKSGLPSIFRTLPQAELLHKALVSKLGFGTFSCPELVGRDDAGLPLKGHKHCHILPVDFDGDGHLDHIILFAPMKFGERAQQAVLTLRKTYMKGGAGELRVAIAGLGSLSDLRTLGAGMSSKVNELLGHQSQASSWVSATPFVPPRHLKRKGRSSLIGQIEEELSVRGFLSRTVKVKIKVLEWGSQTLQLRHFVRRRQSGPQPPIDVGFAVRLTFEGSVSGPICLGYASHFGLGMFRTSSPTLSHS